MWIVTQTFPTFRCVEAFMFASHAMARYVREMVPFQIHHGTRVWQGYVEKCPYWNSSTNHCVFPGGKRMHITVQVYPVFALFVLHLWSRQWVYLTRSACT